MDDKTREAMERLEARTHTANAVFVAKDAQAILDYIATLEARDVDIDALVERLAAESHPSHPSGHLMAVYKRILTEALAPKPEVPVGSWWQNADSGHVCEVSKVDADIVWLSGLYGALSSDGLLKHWYRVNPPTPWEGE